MATQHKSLTQDLFEDMGRKVAEASQEGVSEDESKVVDQIESLCMNCYENGITRLLLTKIPYFREIVLMSFDCPHCGFRNSEIQPAGQIQPRGIKYSLKADSSTDMSRQVVKSDTCIFRVEDLDLEIPPGRGQLTNVEGILAMIKQDLGEKQDERKEVIPEVYEKIEAIITALGEMTDGKKLPFTISLDDPAGNSWIEPSTKDKSGKWSRHEYNRTEQQNIDLGLAADPKLQEVDAPDESIRPEYHANQMYPQLPAEKTVNNVDDDDIIEGQVYSFPSFCPGCQKDCATNMKMVNIPHFKQVILMSTVCDHCGYRSNEVKTGGEVPEKGRKITLSVQNSEDMSRDILKSESCALSCPELNLSVEPGTLGGRFTTIEGLLSQVRDDLRSNIFDAEGAEGGDSMAPETRGTWNGFFGQLDKAIKAEVKFTLVLEDPLASSYVQSFTAPEPDEQIAVEDYERTEEENEDLGLNDIKVEGYESGQERDEEKAKEDKKDEILTTAAGTMSLEEKEHQAKAGE